MRTIATRYHSFLLRIWRDDFESDWRASLQDVKTGDCHYFASLEALTRFLALKTGEPARSPHLIHEAVLQEA